VLGSELQTAGAEQRKARLAYLVVVNGSNSAGVADDRVSSAGPKITPKGYWQSAV